MLEGAMTVDILVQYRVQSFAINAGMIAIVPPQSWHRVHSADGVTVMSAVIPGDHIDLDVTDPRTVARDPASGALRIWHETAGGTPAVADLNAELAKLTIFQRSLAATDADRKGSLARLASYRDGAVLRSNSPAPTIGNRI